MLLHPERAGLVTGDAARLPAARRGRDDPTDSEGRRPDLAARRRAGRGGGTGLPARRPALPRHRLRLRRARIGPDVHLVVPRKFAIRTFGCQMNEHDSERLAGLWSADGHGADRRAGRCRRDRVQHLLHPRRTPTTSFYGHLGNLKALRADQPDLQIAVGGCLAQKDRELIRTGRPTSTWSSGPTTSSGRPVLLRQAKRERAAGRDPRCARPRRGRPRTSRRPRRCARSPMRRGSPSRPAATTRAPSASCPRSAARRSAGRSTRSWPRSQALARRGVVEVTLLGQNVNSYGRDLTQAAGRSSPSCCARVGEVEGIGRVRFTSPHPKDLRPETIAAMAESPAVCEQLHLPLQSGSDRVLAAMRRGYTAERYLERLARPRGPPSRPGGDDRHHRRASPVRPTTTSRRRWRSWPRPSTTAPTPSSSRRARAPGPRPWRTTSCPTR